MSLLHLILCWRWRLSVLLLSALLCALMGCTAVSAPEPPYGGCQSADRCIPTPTPEVLPTPLPVSSPTAVSTLEPSPAPSSEASLPLAPVVTGTPDPFTGLRIDDLASRQYGGTGIVIGEMVKVEPNFIQYAMSYDSDGLRITGLVDIPTGEGPFPVVIVNHGYLRPEEYQPGFDSWRIADWMAARGYIALMPDYRNYGGSSLGPNPFRIGYAIDVMNLIAQVDSLPQAMPEQIGIIGHSMGGGISMWPMVLSGEVDAVVLYAALSGDVGRNWHHIRRYWDRDTMNALALIYGTPEQSPEGYAQISPINYLDRVRMPVMIHHGTMDESVPYWWSADLYERMQAVGLNVTFWPYPGGGHTLGGRGFETMMERNLAFFEQYVRGNVNTPNP